MVAGPTGPKLAPARLPAPAALPPLLASVTHLLLLTVVQLAVALTLTLSPAIRAPVLAVMSCLIM